MKKTPEINSIDRNTLLREQRVVDFTSGNFSPPPTSLKAKANLGYRQPNTSHLGDRSTKDLNLTWKPASERLIVGADMNDAGKVFDPKSSKTKLKNNADYVGTYNNYNGILRPEYDMLEPFVIYDTEVYVKQSINRRLALMFRNGWEVSTDLEQDMDQGQKNVEYIYKRLQTLEYVTGSQTQDFFKKLLFNMLLCSNCFLRKVRDNKISAGVKKEANNNKEPVAFYQLIPAHTLLPYLEKGVLKHWRRFYDTGTPWEDYTTEEIIHLKWDVKPGHIYGTPRTVGVRDDIFALRRLEENIELLFINHLFPLFHVKVGNEKAPCTYGPNGESEIDVIRYQIETMPKEGIFTTDERVSIDVVGAEGRSLETKDLLAHLKSRVFTGMGVSGIDMGEGDTANRSTADNISQNLKDYIKADMESFGGLIRMHFFKEWFKEANYSVSIQKAVATTRLLFHEIDLDNLIKEQNHIINLYNSHLITEPEARKKLKRPPITKPDKKLTHYWEHIRDLVIVTAEAKSNAEVKAQKELLPMQAEHQEKMTGHAINEMQMQHKLEHKKMESHVAKAEASTKLTHAKAKLASIQGPSLKGASKKATPSSKAVRVKSQPTNQHKTNPGPTRAKSSREEFIPMLRDALLDTRSKMVSDGLTAGEVWNNRSAETIDRVVADFETKYPEDPENNGSNPYTKQLRSGLSRLKAMVSQTTDPEILALLLDVGCNEEDYGSLESDSPEDGE